MNPWHWDGFGGDVFKIKAQNGPVVLVLPIERVTENDTWTRASNRLVVGASALMLRQRQTKNYKFRSRLIGAPQYKRMRRFFQLIRNTPVKIVWPSETWKHPDGNIQREKREAVGGVVSHSYDETNDCRWSADIQLTVTKDRTDVRSQVVDSY